MKDLGVEAIGAGARAENVLRDNGIVLIGELIEKTDEELLELRNMGPTTLRRIKEALAENSLRLKRRNGCDNQITPQDVRIREYFAAHAPAEPKWSFEPVMPTERPKAQIVDDGDGDRVCINDHDMTRWDDERRKQIAVQWPWVWADAVLAASKVKS